MIIQFNQFGSSLGTRHLGRIAKNELDNIFEFSNEKIIFDFSNVNLVTNSFADEVFGKKIAEVGFEKFKEKTTFRNLNPFLEMCIKKAIANRLKEFELCN